jgi:hypothetical protein
MTASGFITEFTTDRGYALKRMLSNDLVSKLYEMLICVLGSELCFLFCHFLLVQTGLFINNEFVAGDSKIDTINPANGKVIASVEAGMFMALHGVHKLAYSSPSLLLIFQCPLTYSWQGASRCSCRCR